MNRLKSILFAVCLVVSGLCSCDKVHEFPEEGKEVDPTEISAEVKVVCQIELNVEKIVTKGAMAPVYSDEDRAKYTRRFNVSVLDNTDGKNEPVYNEILYQEVDDMQPLVLNTSLHARKYNILVWMDYVLKENNSDLHYNTVSGLNLITVRDMSTYVASTDFKDAQTVLYPIDLSGSKEWFKHIVVEIPLIRPVAKITFEAIDFEEFVKNKGYVGPIDELVKNYKIHVVYNGYLATGFNATTQKMNDASVGYGYYSVPWNLKERVDGLLVTRLGYDYVFVNGEESSINVNVEIYDKDGKLVNIIDGIVVPTYRGKETIVRMKFFTREYTPGIGINPVFDGEFNVYV